MLVGMCGDRRTQRRTHIEDQIRLMTHRHESVHNLFERHYQCYEVVIGSDVTLLAALEVIPSIRP